MKQFFIFIFIFGFTVNLFSQIKQEEEAEAKEKRNCVTVGILQGGGSIIGSDFEFLLTDKFGFQIGIGYFGFGGGLNYHFKPKVRSSFLSIQYWNQGLGEYFKQNIIGTTYVFRARKIFTFQIGVGIPLKKGPALPDDYNLPPVMLLYSIGIYQPLL